MGWRGVADTEHDFFPSISLTSAKLNMNMRIEEKKEKKKKENATHQCVPNSLML